MEWTRNKKLIVIVPVILFLIIIGGIIWSSYQTIQTGYEGVLMSYGKPIGVLDPGMHGITPFVQSIATVNTQIQNISTIESASTNDLQEVTTSVTVNYQYDPTHADYIYTNFHGDASGILIPTIQDAIKAVTANYQASELITRREDVKQSIQNLLINKLESYYININSTSITNFQFSQQYQDAIDMKVTAQQLAQAAQNNLTVVTFQAQQQIIQAQAAANATITTALAQAEKTVINANATATSIQLIQLQLQQSPQYLQYLALQQWDGKLPTYWTGNSTFPLITIPGP